MGNFNKGGKFGGHSFNDRDGDRPALHKAICTDCGKPCEVPFKPTPGKSVFCRDCFKKDGDSGADRFGPKNFGKSGNRDSRFEDRPMFETTCAKCGNRCEVPFKPNGEKPVYCKDCFGASKGESFGSKGNNPFSKTFGSGKPDRSNENFEKLNAKLERILKLLEALGQKKEPAKEFVKKEVMKEAAKEAPKREVVAEKPAKAPKTAKPKATKTKAKAK
jgi:CxxC-x17-CxxC domain-containing protein